MIDLHCHILPGIDDGAFDLADSLAMGRVAAGDGIETIAATPHIRHDHDVRIAELPERVAVVNDELRRNEIPVSVVTGGEVAETALEGLDEDELRAVTLGGGGWILLEPRPGPLGDSLLAAVTGLRERGVRGPDRSSRAPRLRRHAREDPGADRGRRADPVHGGLPRLGPAA